MIRASESWKQYAPIKLEGTNGKDPKILKLSLLDSTKPYSGPYFWAEYARNPDQFYQKTIHILIEKLTSRWTG